MSYGLYSYGLSSYSLCSYGFYSNCRVLLNLQLTRYRRNP